jgi:hypothetical protein
MTLVAPVADVSESGTPTTHTTAATKRVASVAELTLELVVAVLIAGCRSAQVPRRQLDCHDLSRVSHRKHRARTACVPVMEFMT